MSVLLKLPTPNATRELLKRLLQPAVDYAWGKDDFIVPASGQWRGELVWLADLEPADPRLALLIDSVSCKRNSKDSRKQIKKLRDKGLELDKYLRGVAIEPASRGRPRGDLLVAVYSDDREVWKDLYASVPKDHLRRSDVFFLRDRQPDEPKFVFTAPSADPDFDWELWLARVRQRHEGDGIRLFWRLPGGVHAEYYVEYGFAHTFPDLRELYPNYEGARLFLISTTADDPSAQRAVAHDKRPRWDAIKLGAADKEMHLEHPLGEEFDVRHEPDAKYRAIEQYFPTQAPLSWGVELQPISEDGADRVHSLEARICAGKEVIARLDDERKALLDRHRDRYHFVLRFEQRRDPTASPRGIETTFERFLLLSRRQLDRFQYSFVQEGDKGYHVVRTRDSFLFQDLHLGLADEVYVQPEHWARMWKLEVFVRMGYQLLPPLDRVELANKFKDAFGRRVSLGEGRCALVRPCEDDRVPFEVVEVQFPTDETSLEHGLTFLNVEFPRVPTESLEAAHTELEEALDQQQQDLESELDTLEGELLAEAEARLKTAQESWNAVAPELERVLGTAQATEGQFALVTEMLTHYGHRWQEFLDAVMTLHEKLVAAKIDALKRLDEWTPEFYERVAAVERANVDVHELLNELSPQIGAALEAARKEHREAELAYEKTKLEYDTVKPQVDTEKRRSEELARRAHQLRVDVVREYQILQQKVAAAKAILDELEGRVVQLEALKAQLDAQLQRIEEALSTLATLVEDLETQSKALDQRRIAWKAEQLAAEEELEQVRLKHEQLSTEIEADQERVATLEKETTLLRADLVERKRDLQGRLDRSNQDLTGCRIENADLDRLTTEIEGLEKELATEETRRLRLSDQLEQRAVAVGAGLDALDDARRQRMSDLSEQLHALSDDLARLSKAELEANTVVGLANDVQVQVQVLDFYHDLEQGQFERIWGATEGEEPA